MHRLVELPRIKSIEKNFKNSIKVLLYDWHWKENLTHKEIAERLKVPRCTITRWFKQLGVSSRSCQRMTKRRWQIRLVKVLKQIKRRKFITDPPCLANKHFFKKWTSEMAYVLGYFAADGCMFVNPRGSHYIEFTSTDREIIEKIKRFMSSKHLLAKRDRLKLQWRTTYHFQIGSKEMFKDLLTFGFCPNKSNVLKFPRIPREFLSDFIRGYFDGDGCVHYGFYARKNRPNKQFILLTNFTSGSKEFLKSLWERLQEVGLSGGCLKKKTRGFELCFSINDSKKLYRFIYQNASKSIFLERKHKKFREAFAIMQN